MSRCGRPVCAVLRCVYLLLKLAGTVVDGREGDNVVNRRYMKVEVQ